MEINQIFAIWDRFEQSSAMEIELDMNGSHLHLKKNTNGLAAIPADGNHANGLAAIPANGTLTNGLATVPADRTYGNGISSQQNAVNDSTSQGGTSHNSQDRKTVKAPLLGTFYQASSPDAEPFVKIGQQVKKGDVIGIIEAMKLMNEVVAKEDGVVMDILVEDGCMVEYDQDLIVLG